MPIINRSSAPQPLLVRITRLSRMRPRPLAEHILRPALGFRAGEIAPVEVVGRRAGDGGEGFVAGCWVHAGLGGGADAGGGGLVAHGPVAVEGGELFVA